MKTILRITCYVTSVLACMSVVALATSSSARRALIYVLPESSAESAAGIPEEEEEDRHALALSDRALKNIGVTEQSATAATLADFQKTIDFPATLVERPGRSSLTIPSPMAGVISKVYRVPGEALREGDPLFDIRFTHEELIRDQTELLSLYLKRDIVEQEINRLKPLGDSIVPRAQRENEFQKSQLDASIEAQRKALLLYGLTEEQIDETISSKRDLIGTFTVSVPKAFVDEEGYQHGKDDGFQLKELLVETGIRVTSGESLAIVSDHCRLYVEGRAYASDQRLLESALTNDQPIRVVFEAGREHRGGAKRPENSLYRPPNRRPIPDAEFLCRVRQPVARPRGPGSSTSPLAFQAGTAMHGRSAFRDDFRVLRVAARRGSDRGPQCVRVRVDWAG